MVGDDFPEFTPSDNDSFSGAATTTVHFQAESNPGAGAARLGKPSNAGFRPNWLT